MKFTFLCPPIAFLALLACLAALVGCSEPAPDLPRLEFLSGMPGEIAVGDTTGALAVTKHSATATGRETREEYYAFTFQSADTSVIKVVQNRRLLGLRAGTSAITAVDDREDARTPSARTVTVK